MRKLYRFLLKLKYWQYLLLFSALLLTYSITIGAFVDSSQLDDTFNNWPVALIFWVCIIHAPITETLMSQTLPIKLGHIILRHNRLGRYRLRRCAWPLMLLSALLFAAGHTYSWGYMMATFLIGIMLAFAYHVARKRKQSASLTVMLIHACINLPPITAYAIARIYGIEY